MFKIYDLAGNAKEGACLRARNDEQRKGIVNS